MAGQSGAGPEGGDPPGTQSPVSEHWPVTLLKTVPSGHVVTPASRTPSAQNEKSEQVSTVEAT